MSLIKDMKKPLLLDGFCKGGGAAQGYMKHFRVVGVDALAKYRGQYPGLRFYQGSPIAFILKNGSKFDAIHTSPPCTGYTAGTRALRKQHGDSRYEFLIEPTREALSALDVPWVIENVRGARDALVDPICLCGSMFDLRAIDTDGEQLRLERHRFFESNFGLTSPGPCQHDRSVRVGGVYGAAPTDKYVAQFIRKGGYNPPRSVQEDLMGIPRGTMTRQSLKKALPPAYTEWVGSQMLKALR